MTPRTRFLAAVAGLLAVAAGCTAPPRLSPPDLLPGAAAAGEGRLAPLAPVLAAADRLAEAPGPDLGPPLEARAAALRARAAALRGAVIPAAARDRMRAGVVSAERP